MNTINIDQKNTLKFPPSFEVTPSWIESINDAFLLQLSLPLVTDKTILKSLLTEKISFLNEGQRSLTSNQILLSKSEKETGNNWLTKRVSTPIITT